MYNWLQQLCLLFLCRIRGTRVIVPLDTVHGRLTRVRTSYLVRAFPRSCRFLEALQGEHWFFCFWSFHTSLLDHISEAEPPLDSPMFIPSTFCHQLSFSAPKGDIFYFWGRIAGIVRNSTFLNPPGLGSPTILRSPAFKHLSVSSHFCTWRLCLWKQYLGRYFLSFAFVYFVLL